MHYQVLEDILEHVIKRKCGGANDRLNDITLAHYYSVILILCYTITLSHYYSIMLLHYGTAALVCYYILV